MRDQGRRGASHRKRFVLGLALAGLLVGVGGLGLLRGAERAEAARRAERTAAVTLAAFAELVRAADGGAGTVDAGDGSALRAELDAATADREPAGESGGLGAELDAAMAEQPAGGPAAGDDGARLRAVVAGFAEHHPEVASLRVVVFDGLLLAASTAAPDVGERAAPRKLERDEKPLYDLGQKLRAAVEGNREQGDPAANRVEEVAIERLPGGVLALAAPLAAADDSIVGMVQVETRAERPTAGLASRSALPALAAALAPALALIALGFVLGERRLPLALVAVLLLAASTWLFGQFAGRTLDAVRRATADAVAERAATEKSGAEQLAAAHGLAASFDAARFDLDAFRQPRGLLDAAGAVDAGQVATDAAAAGDRTKRALAVLFVVALALLLWVGLGGAATTISNLVEHRVAYAYTLPAIVGMLLLVFFPFLYGVGLSFTNANLYNSNQPIFDIWTGLANFADILGDFSVFHRTSDGLVFNYQNFYWTLGFTIVWTIANVSIGVTLGLLLALVLNTKGLAFRPIYRVLLILPWAMPNYITALIWKGMFHPQFGVINQIFQMFGGSAIAWFDRPATSFAAVVSTNGWLSFPFMMVISLGALQSISADLYEAARVDGATRWQQFRSITLPSLKPALVPAVILSVIWTFNMFNIIYLVSGGEPGGATEILITQAYKLAFEQYRYGYAAAYSVVIFLILLAYGTWQNRVTQATEGV